MGKPIKPSHFLVFLSHFLFISRYSDASNTINTTQTLRDGETLLSSGRRFELGFFSPGGNSINRYVGIWYSNTTVTVQTVVWVANRESPLRNTTSGVLRLTPLGQLMIQDGNNNNTVWSTSVNTSSRTVEKPVVQFLDSGNLIIREGNDDRAENYLWQSFDHLTDTFLQDMDYGWNFVTGIERYISAWRSNDDPAPGDYSTHLDITGYPQVVVRRGRHNNGTMVYRLGPWNGVVFSGWGQSERQNLAARGELRMNSSSVYYREDSLDRSIFTRFTLTPSGFCQRLTWSNQSQDWVVYINLPADICDNYGLCGVHGSCNIRNSPVCGCLDRFVPRDVNSWARSKWSGGCVRRTNLSCQGDVFMSYTGIKMPDSRFTWHNERMNLDDCRALCLRDCSCMAYSNLDIRNGGSGCLLWFGELVDIRVVNGDENVLYIRMAASELGSDGKNRRTLIAVLTSLAGVVLLGVALLLFMRKRRKNNQMLRKNGGTGESDEEDLELPTFDLSMLNKATGSFSTYKKLGEGGFGPVYKGILDNGKEVAIKRLSRTSLQGLGEFKNEVICIAKLQHRNLVKLLGCCIDGEEKMLIYEYMPNKSLDLFIFDQTKSKQLDWPKRFHIINGIARGLMYLHQDSRLRIIHRDLKASNILLDSEMNPKISDFGMARIFGGNETAANTNRVVGTYGYMSPEYAADGLFSIKSDVYSFGVLVLETVSGQKNRGFHHEDHHHNLLGHAWILYREERSLDLVDANLVDSFNASELLRSIHMALLCVQQSPEDRPNMSTVVVMLGGEGTLPRAKQPGFFTESEVLNPDNATSNKTSSINEYTVTLLDPR